MICKNCGKQVVDGDRFCSGCGADLSDQTPVIEGAAAENVVYPSVADLKEGEEIKPRRKFNLGYLGMFLGAILMIVAPFLDNSVKGRGIYTKLSVIGQINDMGHVSGYTMAFLLVVCAVFTLLMAYFKKYRITVICAVLSMVCVLYAIKCAGKSPLYGIGNILLLAGGLVMLISSISVGMFEKKHRI